jgi:hypothetical protein
MRKGVKNFINKIYKMFFQLLTPSINEKFIKIEKQQQFVNGKKVDDYEMIEKFDNGSIEIEGKHNNKRFSMKNKIPKFRNKHHVRFNLDKNKIHKPRKIERTLTPFIPKKKTVKEKRDIIQKVSEKNKRKTKKNVIEDKKK